MNRSRSDRRCVPLRPADPVARREGNSSRGIRYLGAVLIGRLRTRIDAGAVLVALAAGLAAAPMVAATAGGPAQAATGGPVARPAYAQKCGQPYPAQRNPANPLDLPVAPGHDPLTGANFFVDGPAHGRAAGAIAQMLGLNPDRMASDVSWSGFQRRITTGALRARVASNSRIAHDVAELSKIAGQPEPQRFSIYSEGGGPGAIFAQVQKIFCNNMTADPGSIPIITTYFMHPALGACPTPAQVRAYNPAFHRRINEMAAATGRRPAVYLLELDAIGSSRCIMREGSMPEWEADLRYEMRKLQALPHTVVYVEAGYSDANPVRYTARILNAVHVNTIRGFYTNDTHNNWTINEVRWATKVSRLTHGAHFIVNTSTNGRGPLLNKDRVHNGNEDLCNPPRRGLGPLDTTHTGFRFADAFLWTHPPGNSSGCGGGPPAGTFWPARAIQLAQNANQRLGPGYPSRPY